MKSKTRIAMPPQATSVIAVSLPGELYTTAFIPKFFGKGSFALMNDGTLGYFKEDGTPLLQIPASRATAAVGKGISNKVDLTLDNQKYIFRISTFTATPFTAAAGAAGLFAQAKVMSSVQEFFEMVSQQKIAPTSQNFTPESTPQSPQVSPANNDVNLVNPQVASQLQAASKKRGKTFIIVGTILLALGLLVTIVSYLQAAQTGGTYYFFWGPILIGIALIVNGIFQRKRR